MSKNHTNDTTEGENGFRIEHDSLGPVSVPEHVLFGAQTQRAVENFPVSGRRLPRRMIRALGLIKRAAAQTNKASGAVAPQLADAIVQAADEVAAGKHDAAFVVDIFQTGSGTSSHMNANEVIANRAIQLLGGVVGSKTPVHPNDHVNRGQSSNDVFPTALNIAAAEAVTRDLLPALDRLHGALADKARAFDDVIKTGRTHLMDAVPIRLGQEFSGYAAMVAGASERITAAQQSILRLPLGGTAVGTGLGADRAFAPAVIARVAEDTGLSLVQAPNLFEALATRDGVVALSGSLRSLAIALTKIANDVRWLASGPTAGLAEIHLPDLQPGSSLMPGKVNPVIPEMVVMVCAEVVGRDATVAWSGAGGSFELNAMTPVIASAILESIAILTAAAELFATRCVAGIEVDRERCLALAERSPSLVTALAGTIGYDRAAALGREASSSGKTIRALCQEQKVLPEAELNRLLDLRAMTGT